MKRTPKKTVKPPPSVTFEAAMKWLRSGKPIRRRAWHRDSLIFRLGADVFVKLPNSMDRGPSVWRPYAQDFLATDWERVGASRAVAR